MELERLELKDVGGLDGVKWLAPQQQQQKEQSSIIGDSSSRQRQQEAKAALTTTQTTREPFWLQDTQDGKCLGPSGGFSECGDATLWFILRRGTQRKSLRMGPFGVEETLEQVDLEEPYRYALQIVDNDYEQQPQPAKETPLPTFAWRQRRELRRQRDCLVPSKVSQKSKRQNMNNGDASSTTPLELGPCVKHKTAWSWRVDPEGFLYLPRDVTDTDDRECLRRTKSSSAVLASCRNNTDADEQRRQQQHHSPPAEDEDRQRLVEFSLVRYHATASSALASTKPSSPAHSIARSKAKQLLSGASDTAAQEQDTETKAPGDSSSEGLPSSVDKAHSHAASRGRVGPSPLFEMNLAGRPLLSNIPTREARKASNQSPFAALKDTNPILFLGAGNGNNNNNNKRPTSRQQRQALGKKKSHGGIHPTNNMGKPSAAANNNLSPPSPVKLRKIEMNPYIAGSEDEVWVDPQTGLKYHTDLREYLGHDRKEYGRHTLVGVGLFTKTMLKIKVYGIAFYVSKRDVLADPSFQEYAGLSAEELRKRPDFYEKLRTMPPPGSDPTEGGYFDRTLFLKTNMQLSTETMRSSLDSDWTKMGDDDKALLINTSMEPRPAEQQMLDEIKRADNPSHCSCAQMAPEEFEAEPSCCARGIELAFTWRKNGAIEVRLNGRLMDSFPRPELATAIFFEYLRTDDPFSPDFMERVVDGFPHLLAPLAQVQGITASVMQEPSSSPKPAGGVQTAFKAISGVADSLSSHAVGAVGAMQQGVADTAANAVNAAQATGDAMRHFGEEAERKRVTTWKSMVALSHQNPVEVVSQLATKAKENPAELFAQLAAKFKGEHTEDPPEEENASMLVAEKDAAPHGRVFRSTTSQWFGEVLEATDEIAPIMHPTMNKTILSLVHMYLLLILIVSFPATNTSRTRFRVRRSSKLMSASSSEASFMKYGQESDLFSPGAHKTAHNGYRNGKTAMPAPCLSAEEDTDPANEASRSPQKIHIDFSSLEGTDSKARGFSGKNGKNAANCSKQANDNMQKSLSYFL